MSTTSSTLTSVLSALGGTSGIDVTAAVDSILYADRAPERTWQAQQTTLASQTSALDALESDATTLITSLSDLLTEGGVLSAVAATSSNSSIVTATAADGTTIGSHTVVVDSLATTGSWYSAQASSSSAALSTGSFDISSGGTAKTVQIASGETLDQLASAINGQSSLGVTASVVTDSSGARLSLVAQSSGTAADFTVSQASGLTFTQVAAAQDASLTVDGVPITSASNTVTGALGGVTLNLQSASAGTTVTVGLAPDVTDIASAVGSFVTAYNQLISDVNTQFSYNSATNTAGALQDDSLVQSLQSDLLNASNYNSGGSTLNTLDALGISTNADGTLALNTSTLNKAISSNPSAVASFFQGSASDGFAATLSSTLDTYTNFTGGAFTVDLQSISSENQDLTNQTNTLELYLSSQKTILTAEYNAADIAIQQLPQKLKQMQALLNPNSSSS
jgi:flagellar hook-associated protein 2